MFDFCAQARLQHNLKSGVAMPPAVLSLFKTALAILGLLHFHVNLTIDFSVSVKNGPGILIGIALTLWIAFDRVAIFTILVLFIYE